MYTSSRCLQPPIGFDWLFPEGKPKLWFGIVSNELDDNKSVSVQWLDNDSGDKYIARTTLETTDVKFVCGKFKDLTFDEGVLSSLFPDTELADAKDQMLSIAETLLIPKKKPKSVSRATNNPMGRHNRTVHCVAGKDPHGNAVPWFAIEMNKTAAKGHHMQWFDKEVKADNKTRLVLSHLSDWVESRTVVAKFADVALYRTETKCVVEVPFTESQLQVAQTAVAAYKDEIALESSRLPVKKRPTIV